jgi:hypothetical protein
MTLRTTAVKPENKNQLQIDKCIRLIIQICVKSDEELDNLRNTEFALERLLNSQPVNYYVQNKDKYKGDLEQDTYHWE